MSIFPNADVNARIFEIALNRFLSCNQYIQMVYYFQIPIILNVI